MLLLIVAYFVLTLPALTALPVFADEAIYIHWAQVAFRVPGKYAFLPMLDGKPPLHPWLLIPFLQLFSDPLFAGRLLSVIAGLFTALLMVPLVHALGGGKREGKLACLFAMFLPFFYFHNRMALAESLLTLLFTLGFFAAMRLMQTKKKKFGVMFAVALGGALWTKTTALFFIPLYAFVPLLVASMKSENVTIASLKRVYTSVEARILVIAGIGGGVIFGLLAFTKLFTDLFHRSEDYTFSISELLNGQWQYVAFHSFPLVLWWVIWYLTPFVIVLAIFVRRRQAVLWEMTFLYLLPVVALGKVTAARYFFPISILIVCLAALGFERLHEVHRHVAKFLVVAAFLQAGMFIFFSLANPAAIPFTSQDRAQYLTDWSSGYGIKEVAAYVTAQAEKHNHITVATEGYFGTLPDGLEIYFDHSPVMHNVTIEGIGEPILSFQPELIALASSEPVYVVVNKDRFLLNDPTQYQIVASYPRPFNAPPLLLLQIKAHTIQHVTSAKKTVPLSVSAEQTRQP